ncbi:hypothetical protein GCM10027275_40280 [Rhabdobacter roseus]
MLLWFIAFPTASVLAQPKPPGTFELKDGDRVVFLGNSLFENDLPYGYLELALATRWPHRNVTYRNLGWTGDTVWGEARSYFTNPPTAYDLLMDQLTKAQPTVVFIAYGGIEALEGEAGLPRFREGLQKLLDKVDELGARAVLLSPIPVTTATAAVATAAERNAKLEMYASAVAKMAVERGKPFIDLYGPMREAAAQVPVSDNGIHLNETGYYYLALALEKGLGLAQRGGQTTLTVSKNSAQASAPAKILAATKPGESLRFTIEEKNLPLPLPKEGGTPVRQEQVLKVLGLKKGFYTLTADGAPVATASAQDWAAGVALSHAPSYRQVSQLQEMIFKKNELFFHQYRPQNRTYILGFRSYEQGRHVQGLAELGLIIKWLEGQIALQGQPKSPVYELTLLK